MKSYNAIFILTVCLFCRCKNDKFKPPVTTIEPIATAVQNCGTLAGVSYSMQIQPIINANCLSCHDASTGFKLYDYSHVVLFANSGQLTGCLTGDQSFLQMPPGVTMDSCSVKAIVNWVKQGKLNN